jgi:hypothetical protein
MPVVICKTHGRNPAPLLCQHAAKAVWANQPFEKVTFIDLDGFMVRGWLCEDCLNLSDIQRFRKSPGIIHETSSESEIERLLGLIDFQPVCFKCFEELVRKREK